MKIKNSDLMKLCSPGKQALITTRDWLVWMAHCSGHNPKQIAADHSISLAHVARVLSHGRENWVTYFDEYDPCTWN